MRYSIIISPLTEKLFYLLRSQSFSFQIVSEFIDTFVKFSNFMSKGWGFDSLFCPEGRVFVHNDCPGGEGFCSLQVVSLGFVPGGWFWMKLIPALINCVVSCMKIILKATSHSTILDIPTRPLKIKNTNIVLPVKEGPQLS